MNSQRRVWGLLILVAAVVLLASCAPAMVRITAEPVPQARAGDGETPLPPTPTSPPAADPGNPCNQPPIAVPTPAPDPGYAQLDPSTGLHVTGKMQLIDLATYRLRVTGKVEKSIELSYDQIRCLPKVQASPILTCPGFFTDEDDLGGRTHRRGVGPGRGGGWGAVGAIRQRRRLQDIALAGEGDGSSQLPGL